MPESPGRRGRSWHTYALRFGVLGYLALLLFIPVALIAYRTFEHGLGAVYDALTTQQALHAAQLSVVIAAISVSINLVFGVGTAYLLARRRMPLPWLVNGLVNLPFAMSPVVIGLAVYLVYAQNGWLGAHGFAILFSYKAMILATTFVNLPFVLRETVPVLEELGTDQEQAASVLGAGPWYSFTRVTLPAIRWAVVYGVVLSTARALGEYGAVSIVSGNVVGQTQTLPLLVEERFRNFDSTAAYSAGFLLAVISLLILLGMTLLTSRRRRVEV